MKTFHQWLEAQNAVRFAPSVGDWDQDAEEAEREDYENKNWLYRYDRPIDDRYDDVEQMYDNYEKSMNRRRPGIALDFDGFLNRIYDQNTHNFRFGDSIVFGSYTNGIFFPSHFAPSSLRQAREMLEKLKEYRVVWAVTPDLTSMIESMGYIKILTGVPISFRGGTVLKDILVSNRRLIPEIKKMYANYTKAVHSP